MRRSLAVAVVGLVLVVFGALVYNASDTWNRLPMFIGSVIAVLGGIMAILGVIITLIQMDEKTRGGNNTRRSISIYQQTLDNTRPTDTPKPTRLWYLLPVFSSIIGGLIAYFYLRNKDKDLATGCLIVGIVIFVLLLFALR